MKTFIVVPRIIGAITAYAVQSDNEENALEALKKLNVYIGTNPKITDISANKVFTILDMDDPNYEG